MSKIAIVCTSLRYATRKLQVDFKARFETSVTGVFPNDVRFKIITTPERLRGERSYDDYVLWASDGMSMMDSRNLREMRSIVEAYRKAQ